MWAHFIIPERNKIHRFYPGFDHSLVPECGNFGCPKTETRGLRTTCYEPRGAHPYVCGPWVLPTNGGVQRPASTSKSETEAQLAARIKKLSGQTPKHHRRTPSWTCGSSTRRNLVHVFRKTSTLDRKCARTKANCPGGVRGEFHGRQC